MHEVLKKRIQQLSKPQKSGQCVVYIMSRDQRVKDNHALLAAQKHALAKQLPLVVLFCLYDKSGFRAREHYEFMLDGLHEVEQDLKKLHIPLAFLIGDAKKLISTFVSTHTPDAVYLDFNTLVGPRSFATFVSGLGVATYVVDTHNVIPCWVASDKREYAAATFRPKVHQRIAEFLEEPDKLVAHPYTFTETFISMSEQTEAINKIVRRIKSNGTKVVAKPGEQAANDVLETFITTRLKDYAELRNDPANNFISDLSPYLHFGQISALRVTLELRKIAHQYDTDLHILSSKKLPQAEMFDKPEVAGLNALLEEMIVRKELADNFCYYQPNYTTTEAADNWARQTIQEHDKDPREYMYSYEQLEHAQTHDDAWNAAQKQMTTTGKMHGYMRMYWAKKVKEWTPDARTAIDYLVKLNDFYSIDGGDPNGYTGIMWSVCGIHDRPWTERSVFGKIRYMNQNGLLRKFDINSYINKYLNK